MFTPRGPVAGSFQHTLWPRERALEVAILASHAFASVFSWYKVIIALSLYFSSWAFQYSVHTSIIAAKIVSWQFFLRAPIFLFGLQAHSNKNSNTSPVSAKCRLQTGYKMQTVYKMQTKSLYCFFVRYVITCHLTTYQASRNRFSAIIFHDYLQYCGIFLARFLITVVLNIISSLHIVFSFCARVGWCDVGTEFTHLIKVDADVDVT